MFFSEILGFKELKHTLTQSVQTNHLAHALLFRGQEGGAGIAIALAFANYVLCANRTETEPCGECSVCQKTKKYIHPDLHFVVPYKSLADKDEDSGKAEMMAQWRTMLSENQWPTLHDWANAAGIESKQISISVKESRKILYNVALKPFEVEQKVIFIWLPELLGNEAANALLKVLEEPNARTLFILIASDYDKILPTIISRTQLISIPRFSETEIASELETKHQIEPEKAVQIARLAEGNMNEAIKLTTDMPDNNLTHCRNWFRLCFGQKMIELVAFADEFQAMGKEPQKSLLQFTLAMLRETIIWNFGDENLVKLSVDERDFISKFAPLIQPNKVEKISQWINESYYQLERNVSAKLVFLDLSIMVSKIIKS